MLILDDFFLKTKYEIDKLHIEKKIHNTSAFVKKTDYSSKITEIEIEIPSISGLATNSALIAIENRIPAVTSLLKKTDYNTKIRLIKKNITDHDHDKYITFPEFNTLAANVFNARLVQANVITKSDFGANLQSLSKSITSNKTKNLLV